MSALLCADFRKYVTTSDREVCAQHGPYVYPFIHISVSPSDSRSILSKHSLQTKISRDMTCTRNQNDIKHFVSWFLVPLKFNYIQSLVRLVDVVEGPSSRMKQMHNQEFLTRKCKQIALSNATLQSDHLKFYFSFYSPRKNPLRAPNEQQGCIS